MFAWLGEILGGIGASFIKPLFDYLGRKQDVTLQGFQTATGGDVAAYTAYLNYLIATEAQRTWWGAHLLFMLVGGSAALHISAVFLDSTFKFGWAIPALPTAYLPVEQMLLAFLFGAPMLSSLSHLWLARR